MRQLTLKDFENLPWRTYQKENPHKCVFCNEIANNGGHNMCNSHTDTYRRLKKEQEEKCIEMRLKELKLDLSQIENIEFDGVYHYDAPKYCDAYISAASQNGIELTEDQLEFINDSLRDFVYDKLQEWLY